MYCDNTTVEGLLKAVAYVSGQMGVEVSLCEKRVLTLRGWKQRVSHIVCLGRVYGLTLPELSACLEALSKHGEAIMRSYPVQGDESGDLPF